MSRKVFSSIEAYIIQWSPRNWAEKVENRKFEKIKQTHVPLFDFSFIPKMNSCVYTCAYVSCQYMKFLSKVQVRASTSKPSQPTNRLHVNSSKPFDRETIDRTIDERMLVNKWICLQAIWTFILAKSVQQRWLCTSWWYVKIQETACVCILVRSSERLSKVRLSSSCVQCLSFQLFIAFSARFAAAFH